MTHEPHAKRGSLRHGNPSGDLTKALRCGAKTRAGHPCRQPGMRNGRCRLHGGKSTGPKTTTGALRSRTTRLCHGRYSQKEIQQRREDSEILRELRALARRLG